MQMQNLYFFCITLLSGYLIQFSDASPVSSAVPSALISSTGSCLASGEYCTKGEDFDCCSCACLPLPADQDVYVCGATPLCTVNLDPPHVDQKAAIEGSESDEEHKTEQGTGVLDNAEQSTTPAADLALTNHLTSTPDTCIPESGYCDPSNPNHCCSCQCFWSLFYGYLCGGGDECKTQEAIEDQHVEYATHDAMRSFIDIQRHPRQTGLDMRNVQQATRHSQYHVC